MDAKKSMKSYFCERHPHVFGGYFDKRRLCHNPNMQMASNLQKNDNEFIRNFFHKWAAKFITSTMLQN